MRPSRPDLDEAGILALYWETIRPLYAYVSRRVGGDRPLAEDLVQEVWMRALAAWPARGVPREPLAWLVRVARNALVSHFRRRRPDPVDPSAIDIEAAGVPAETPEAAALVGMGLARLRRAHADLLEAFYFDGRSARELAAERGLTERAVEARLHRARARLKAALEPLLSPAGAGGDRPGVKHHAGQTRTR